MTAPASVQVATPKVVQASTAAAAAPAAVTPPAPIKVATPKLFSQQDSSQVKDRHAQYLYRFQKLKLDNTKVQISANGEMDALFEVFVILCVLFFKITFCLCLRNLHLLLLPVAVLY
jgi:hypothetical protein